jgi:hypothetical protein
MTRHNIALSVGCGKASPLKRRLCNSMKLVSPIKERVKRKNTSPMQKIYFFLLVLDGFAKSPNLETDIVAKVKYSGLVTNPSTLRNSTALL